MQNNDVTFRLLNNKHNNNIGVKGAKHLGKGISNCISLTSLELHLFDNRIFEDGANYLVEGI